MPSSPLTGRRLPGLQRRQWLALASLFAAGPFAAGNAGAQPSNYPTRPIRLLVGDGAGSTADSVARALVPQLQAELGQPVRVENWPGLDGAAAAKAVIDAPGDGHTLLLASNAAGLTLAAEPALMPIALVCRLQPSSPTSTWLGLMGPANMHAGVAMRVHAAVQRLLATAELQGRLAAVGAEPLPLPRQAFTALLQARQQ